MNNPKHRKQEKHRIQIKHLRSCLITTVMILVPCYVLGTNNTAISAFAQTATIWETKGKVSMKSNGGTYPVTKGDTMEKNSDILLVPGNWTASAKISIGECFDAQGGPDREPSKFNFPNAYEKKWTIGMADEEPNCYGILLQVLEPETQFRRTDAITQVRRTDAIQVSRVGNEPTVVQTDQQNDAAGRKLLVVDVLLGTVIIKSPQGRTRTLEAGQRYIYYVDGRRDSVQKGIASATDCSAVNSFLDLNKWPEKEDIRRRINSYQPARRLCSPTQNPTQNPIPQ